MEQCIQPLERRILMAAQPAAAAIFASPADSLAITVTGTAKWTDLASATHAIPLAYVEIRTSTEADSSPALATGSTDINGNFSIPATFDSTSGAMIYARIYARNPAADVKPDTGSTATTYFMNTSSVAVTAAGSIAIPEKDGSNSVVAEESFSILGAALQAQTYATVLDNAAGQVNPTPSQVDTRFPSNTAVNGSASFFSSSGTPSAHITQRRVFDWDVIEHEYGHYVFDRVGVVANTYNLVDHSFQNATPKAGGPGLAWQEGIADWFGIEAQLKEPEPYSTGVPEVGDTAYDPQGAPADTNPYFDLASGVGVGEDDEASIAAVLYHLDKGDQGIQISDTTLFKDMVTSTAGTFGAEYLAIAASLSGEKRSELGKVIGTQLIAPVITSPTAATPVNTSTIPTFTWTANGNNDFVVEFYSSDFSTMVGTSGDLGDVTTYTPSAATWSSIFDGHSTVKFVVEGSETDAPATPGSVSDGTYSGQTLSRYWSEAGKLNAPSIGIVLDITGSMQPEIDSVEQGLVDYISNLQASLTAGETPPTIELTTFIDYPMTVISSNDLDAVKADIQEQSAGGGGDIPEPSAQSLEYASHDIAPGGTMLLITDAPSDAGTDLDGTIADLRAKGITVNAIISGDDSYTDEPTDTVSSDAVHTGVLPTSMTATIESDLAGASSSSSADSTTTSTASTAIAASPADDSTSTEDGPEPQQTAITDAGQIPIDDVGTSTSNATPLTVDGPIAHSLIGIDVQDPANPGNTISNNDEWYSFSLNAGTSYNIPVLTDGDTDVNATVYGSDGVTSIASGSTTVGDPDFGYETLTFTPATTGTYYLDINGYDATGYTVQVSDNPLVGADSSVVLWTTTANATGGEFLYKPQIESDSSDPTTVTNYTSSIENVMDSTFEPSVLSATPSSLPAGTTLDVTFTGRKTNWIEGQSSIAFPDTDLTVNSVTVNSPTSITASVTVGASAAVNFSDVTVTTPLGATTEKAIGYNAVNVTTAPTTATLLQVEPGSLSRGDSETVKIVGTMTAWDSTSTLSLGPGVTVTGVNVVSPTEILATATVDNSASIGFRVATVSTTSTGAVDTQDMALTLSSAPVTAIATIASLSPAQAPLGAHVVITVTGMATHFVAGETIANFGAGVTVDSVNVTDSTHAVVTLDITGSATPGFTNVVLTTGTESATSLDGFLVQPTIPISVSAPASAVTPMLPFEPTLDVPFTVTLATASSAAVTVDYTTSDGTAAAGTDYTATTGTLSIPAGSLTGTIYVPLVAQTTTQASKTFNITLSNASSGSTITSATASATIAAITITSQAITKKPLTYTDSAGKIIHVSLTGPGTGTLYFVNGSADPADVAVTGSTAHTSLTISGATVASPAPIGGFGINGPMAAVSAANTVLFGSSAFAGAVSRLTLGSNTGAGDLLQLNGATVPAAITAKSLDGLTVTSSQPIRSLAVTSFASGSLSAPSLSSFTDRGSMGAALTLSGGNTAAHVTGAVTGATWNTAGSITSLVATGGLDSGWTGFVTGNLGALTTSNLDGSITVGGTLRSLNVTKNMTGNVTAAAIGTLHVTGSVTGSQVRSATTIKSASVGSISNALVFAGVNSTVTTAPASASDLSDATGSILAFSTRVKEGFSNTEIAAATLGSVSIKGAAVSGAGGVAAEKYTSFTFTQPGEKAVHFTTRKAGAVIPTFLGTDFVLTELS